MSDPGFDPGAIGDLLKTLTPEDIASLQDMAKTVFSGAGSDTTGAGPGEPAKGAPSGGVGAFGGLDLETITKLASVMELLQSESRDPRVELLAALRPLLGEERRPKVDQAARMLQLFSLLPKIKELGLF